MSWGHGREKSALAWLSLPRAYQQRPANVEIGEGRSGNLFAEPFAALLGGKPKLERERQHAAIDACHHLPTHIHRQKQTGDIRAIGAADTRFRKQMRKTQANTFIQTGSFANAPPHG